MNPSMAAKTKEQVAIVRKAAIKGHAGIGAALSLPLPSGSSIDDIADASGFHLSRAVGRHNNRPPWWACLL
jgi:hypothetical protein